VLVLGGISVYLQTSIWQLNTVDPQLFEPQFSQISELHTITYKAELKYSNMCAATG